MPRSGPIWGGLAGLSVLPGTCSGGQNGCVMARPFRFGSRMTSIWIRCFLSLVLLITVSSIEGECGGQPTPDTSGVVKLIGRHSSAHACPVEPRRAFTSAHVVDLAPFDASVRLAPYRWQVGEVNGIAYGNRALTYVDLGEIVPIENSPDFPVVFPIASAAPQPGDHLWIQGYDFRKGSAAYAPRVWEVTTLRVVAGHIIMKPSVDHGTSGSCILNASGEVVGILNWGMVMGDNSEIGVGVGVWNGLLLPRSQNEQ